ncbi:MAG: carbohydrate porin [Granulosicoccaceae bacterium]
MHSKKTTIHKQALSCTALLVSLACAPAAAEISLGGNVELDTTFQQNAGGADGENYSQGGRVQLNASGTQTVGDATLAGKGTINLTKDGGTGIDDVWFSLGRGKWSLKFGRFEGIETFSKGTDTILNVLGTATNYQGSAVRGRSGADYGQIALDVAANDRVSFQLGTFWGETSGNDENAISGFRPAITAIVTDDLNVSASYETLDIGGVETDGLGLYIRYATDAFALKMNAASGSTGDVDHTTFNVNIESGNIGLGYHSTEDEGGAADDSASTIYARYLFPNLMGSENTNAQLGASIASADSAEEDETALRLRFFHTF